MDTVLSRIDQWMSRIEQGLNRRANPLELGAMNDNTVVIALKNSAAIAPGAFTEEDQPQRIPGSVIAYDPTNASFDVLVQVQTNNSSKWVTLLPGKPYDIRPRTFREFKLRFLKKASGATAASGTVLNIPAGTFLGTLFVANDLDINIVGASGGTAMYTRPIPSLLTFGNRVLTSIGSLGIFSNRDTLPSLIDGQCVMSEVEITNDGVEDIYLGTSSAITSDTVGNRLLVRRIIPGASRTIVLSGRPANPQSATPTPVDDVVFVYCASSSAFYSFTRRDYFI